MLALTLSQGQSRYALWINRIGAALAGICAVHCFIFMLGSVSLSFTAYNHLLNPGLRWLMVLMVAIFTVGSLMTRGVHQGRIPSAWLQVTGLAAVIVANLWGTWSIGGEILSLTGGLTLATGHMTQLANAKGPHRAEKISANHDLPRKIGFALLLVTLSVVLFNLPSLLRYIPGWGEETISLDDERSIGWDVLGQLNLDTGEVGPELQSALGERVKIPGFVVPLDEEGKAFLLVPYHGACIHGPPPPMNQIVSVTMLEESVPVQPWSWEPIWVLGTLKVLEVESPFGSAGFEMQGITTELFR